jgi:hypothetical protein
MSIFFQQGVFGFYISVNNASLVKKVHGQSQFGRVKLHCFFRESPSPFAQGPHVTTGHVHRYIDPFFLSLEE